MRIRYWSFLLLAFIGYCLIFFLARHASDYGKALLIESQPALLLFLLPGMLIAVECRLYALRCACMVGIVATLTCLICMVIAEHPYLSDAEAFIWCLSGIFWSMCGALVVILRRKFSLSQRNYTDR